MEQLAVSQLENVRHVAQEVASKPSWKGLVPMGPLASFDCDILNTGSIFKYMPCTPLVSAAQIHEESLSPSDWQVGDGWKIVKTPQQTVKDVDASISLIQDSLEQSQKAWVSQFSEDGLMFSSAHGGLINEQGLKIVDIRESESDIPQFQTAAKRPRRSTYQKVDIHKILDTFEALEKRGSDTKSTSNIEAFMSESKMRQASSQSNSQQDVSAENDDTPSESSSKREPKAKKSVSFAPEVQASSLEENDQGESSPKKEFVPPVESQIVERLDRPHPGEHRGSRILRNRRHEPPSQDEKHQHNPTPSQDEKHQHNTQTRKDLPRSRDPTKRTVVEKPEPERRKNGRKSNIQRRSSQAKPQDDSDDDTPGERDLLSQLKKMNLTSEHVDLSSLRDEYEDEYVPDSGEAPAKPATSRYQLEQEQKQRERQELIASSVVIADDLPQGPTLKDLQENPIYRRILDAKPDSFIQNTSKEST